MNVTVMYCNRDGDWWYTEKQTQGIIIVGVHQDTDWTRMGYVNTVYTSITEAVQSGIFGKHKYMWLK